VSAARARARWRPRKCPRMPTALPSARRPGPCGERPPPGHPPSRLRARGAGGPQAEAGRRSPDARACVGSRPATAAHQTQNPLRAQAGSRAQGSGAARTCAPRRPRRVVEWRGARLVLPAAGVAVGAGTGRAADCAVLELQGRQRSLPLLALVGQAHAWILPEQAQPPAGQAHALGLPHGGHPACCLALRNRPRKQSVLRAGSRNYLRVPQMRHVHAWRGFGEAELLEAGRANMADAAHAGASHGHAAGSAPA